MLALTRLRSQSNLTVQARSVAAAMHGNACGCMDSTAATNYDETAEYDDGSCILLFFACTDCDGNYDMEANTEWLMLGVGCNGDCGGSADWMSAGICNIGTVARFGMRMF